MALRDLMEKYKSGTGGDFFVLENDKDTATVRFLYDSKKEQIDNLEGSDLDAYVVHEVEIAGKKRYVKCLETGDCPLCKAANKPMLKIFIQLLDGRDNKVKVWERGDKYISRLLGLMNKYGQLCNRPYDVERDGKKKDPKTVYNIYSLDRDDKTLADFPEKQKLLGSLILVKTKKELAALVNGEVADNEPPQQRHRQPEEDVF